jgi:hypothetical protein
MNSPAGVPVASPHDYMIARDQDFLDFPFQVGDGLETLSHARQNLIAADADVIAPTGHPLRRGRLPDEFGAVFGEFSTQGFVERRDTGASRFGADLGPG